MIGLLVVAISELTLFQDKEPDLHDLQKAVLTRIGSGHGELVPGYVSISTLLHFAASMLNKGDRLGQGGYLGKEALSLCES